MNIVQHVEFFHKHHFDFHYLRKKPERSLAAFIEFFWETDFEALYKQFPQGFSDALFPNIGYTYLINLGTPFVMQLEDEQFPIKNDVFLPRHKHMICHHSVGNKIFGIKFKISPVIFEKKINFSEYREYIFPLAYLIDRDIVAQIKSATSFEARMAHASEYFSAIIEKHHGSKKQISIVSQILEKCNEQRDYNASLEKLASDFSISSRTLQRYFEAATSLTGKNALQILRIRKAVETLANNPEAFHYKDFGYYDYSHFYKHLKQFLAHSAVNIKPHLQVIKQGLL